MTGFKVIKISKLFNNACISLVLFMSCLVLTNAQYGTKAEIKNLNFKLKGDKVYITYDLVNTRSGDLFDIEVNIFTSAGQKIEAHSFEGKLSKVKRGRKHQIIWYIAEDYKNFEDNIYVELNAYHKNFEPVHPVSRGEALIKSTIWPGWGSAQTTLKKSNYLKGFIGYGFLISSGVFHTFADLSDFANPGADTKSTAAQVTLGMAGLIWGWEYGKILFTPNISKNIKIDVESYHFNNNYIPMLSLKINLNRK